MRELGLSEHVLFDDRFVDVEELASMLSATTVYVTPYHSREQIVSGALTFAVVGRMPGGLDAVSLRRGSAGQWCGHIRAVR